MPKEMEVLALHSGFLCLLFHVKLIVDSDFRNDIAWVSSFVMVPW